MLMTLMVGLDHKKQYQIGLSVTKGNKIGMKEVMMMDVINMIMMRERMMKIMMREMLLLMKMYGVIVALI
jgi:hypothetical protein